MPIKRVRKRVFHYSTVEAPPLIYPGDLRKGPHTSVLVNLRRARGNVSNIFGVATRLTGDLSGLRGFLFNNIQGDASNVKGTSVNLNPPQILLGDVTALKGDISNIWGFVGGPPGNTVEKILDSARQTAEGNPVLSAALGAVLSVAKNKKPLRGDVSNISGHVSFIHGDATRIRGDVSGIAGDVSALSGDVSTLKGDVTNLSGDVTNLNGFVSFVKGDATNVHGTLRLELPKLDASFGPGVFDAFADAALAVGGGELDALKIALKDATSAYREETASLCDYAVAAEGEYLAMRDSHPEMMQLTISMAAEGSSARSAFLGAVCSIGSQLQAGSSLLPVLSDARAACAVAQADAAAAGPLELAIEAAGAGPAASSEVALAFTGYRNQVELALQATIDAELAARSRSNFYNGPLAGAVSWPGLLSKVQELISRLDETSGLASSASSLALGWCSSLGIVTVESLAGMTSSSGMASKGVAACDAAKSILALIYLAADVNYFRAFAPDKWTEIDEAYIKATQALDALKNGFAALSTQAGTSLPDRVTQPSWARIVVSRAAECQEMCADASGKCASLVMSLLRGSFSPIAAEKSLYSGDILDLNGPLTDALFNLRDALEAWKPSWTGDYPDLLAAFVNSCTLCGAIGVAASVKADYDPTSASNSIVWNGLSGTTMYYRKSFIETKSKSHEDCLPFFEAAAWLSEKISSGAYQSSIAAAETIVRQAERASSEGLASEWGTASSWFNSAASETAQHFSSARATAQSCGLRGDVLAYLAWHKTSSSVAPGGTGVPAAWNAVLDGVPGLRQLCSEALLLSQTAILDATYKSRCAALLGQCEDELKRAAKACAPEWNPGPVAPGIGDYLVNLKGICLGRNPILSPEELLEVQPSDKISEARERIARAGEHFARAMALFADTDPSSRGTSAAAETLADWVEAAGYTDLDGVVALLDGIASRSGVDSSYFSSASTMTAAALAVLRTALTGKAGPGSLEQPAPEGVEKKPASYLGLAGSAQKLSYVLEKTGRASLASIRTVFASFTDKALSSDESAWDAWSTVSYSSPFPDPGTFANSFKTAFDAIGISVIEADFLRSAAASLGGFAETTVTSRETPLVYVTNYGASVATRAQIEAALASIENAWASYGRVSEAARKVGSAIVDNIDLAAILAHAAEIVRGDISKLKGDISGLWGDVSGLEGLATGLKGDCTDLRGSLDDVPVKRRLLSDDNRKIDAWVDAGAYPE